VSDANPYHRPYFPAFTVNFLAEVGQPLPPLLDISDLYAPLIDEHWQQHEKGEILSIITRGNAENRELDWAGLGSQLTTDLLAMGTYAGLSFDGQLGFDAELAWLPQFYAGVLGVLDLKVTYDAHPILKWPVKNVTWNSLQAISGDSWLHSLWRNIKSGWFNQGCDLLVSVYDTDVASAITWSEPLTIAAFGRTLERAVGWMIPIDGNIGFIVGLPPESMLYTNLTASQPTASHQ